MWCDRFFRGQREKSVKVRTRHLNVDIVIPRDDVVMPDGAEQRTVGKVIAQTVCVQIICQRFENDLCDLLKLLKLYRFSHVTDLLYRFG